MLYVEEKHLTPEPLKELTLLYEPITLTPKEGLCFGPKTLGPKTQDSQALPLGQAWMYAPVALLRALYLLTIHNHDTHIQKEEENEGCIYFKTSVKKMYQ